MEFDVLIPTQEKNVAYDLIDYADGLLNAGFPLAKKMAKEIVRGKYWEAVDCERPNRQEYWRNVLGSFDTIDNFKTPNP